MVCLLSGSIGSQRGWGSTIDWPNDADGDVMRRLQRGGFTFDREVAIDFNIDFERWPPDASIMAVLANAFPSATVSVEEGYVRVQVRSLLTYDFVMKTQADLTQICAAFGGICESWGILWNPNASQPGSIRR
ncbi:ribonuclease E inhibitor RraB [Asticcacaulis sp. 201]|uniref:ribonuclease E inhibitor RraB n=1 Tax=Asticcacaulis sp. 201 TaxID=3028787 RepID=UPI003982FEE2